MDRVTGQGSTATALSARAGDAPDHRPRTPENRSGDRRREAVGDPVNAARADGLKNGAFTIDSSIMPGPANVSAPTRRCASPTLPGLTRTA